MKKIRIKLNERQLELLKMIHILSAEKDYLIVDQLMKFLLLFTYKTESAARMSMKKLEELGMIEKKEKETTNYKHVFLTYRGALHLDFDQKKKPEYFVTTEDTIVRRVEYLYNIARSRKADNFDRFITKMNETYYSTLLLAAGAKSGLKYNDTLKNFYASGSVLDNQKLSNLYHHEQSLIWNKGLLTKNLKNTAVKINDDICTPNIAGMFKKNIYIRRSFKDAVSFHVEYLKFLNHKVPYSFEKFIRDLVYIHKINNSIFPHDAKLKYEIVAQSESEKHIIDESLKQLEFENPEQKAAYEKYKDCFSVVVLDVDQYLIRKDKYDCAS